MDEQTTDRAARAAYEAHCAVHGIQTVDRDFKTAIIEWRAIAAAVAGVVSNPDWPLRARVRTRTSVEPNEKVLEIEGTIGDTHVSSRHTQSMAVKDEDVPGLPELHRVGEIPMDASVYVKAIARNLGMDGLRREAERLIHKIETASSLYREGTVKAALMAADPMRERISIMAARDDVGGVCREIDNLQARIVTAQRMADPWGKASLVLHTSEEKWDRYDSYQAMLDGLEKIARGESAR